jgi:hypothetical protein
VKRLETCDPDATGPHFEATDFDIVQLIKCSTIRDDGEGKRDIKIECTSGSDRGRWTS